MPHTKYTKNEFDIVVNSFDCLMAKYEENCFYYENRQHKNIHAVIKNIFRNIPFNQIFIAAIKLENIKLIKMLITYNYSCTFAFSYAAERGNIEILELLLKHEYSWDDYTFMVAAFMVAEFKQNMTVIKWLLKHKCPFGRLTHESCMIKYNNKYGWFKYRYTRAEVSPWLVKHGFIKIIFKRCEVSQWLINNGCTSGYEIDSPPSGYENRPHAYYIMKK